MFVGLGLGLTTLPANDVYCGDDVAGREPIDVTVVAGSRMVLVVRHGRARLWGGGIKIPVGPGL